MSMSFLLKKLYEKLKYLRYMSVSEQNRVWYNKNICYT